MEDLFLDLDTSVSYKKIPARFLQKDLDPRVWRSIINNDENNKRIISL